MGRCVKCYKEGVGSGICSSCQANDSFVDNHMAILHDLEPHVAELNAIVTRQFCICMTYICTSAFALIVYCCCSSKSELKKPFLSPEVNEEDIRVHHIQEYLKTYNNRNIKQMNEFVDKTYSNDYLSESKAYGLSWKKSDLYKVFNDGFREKRQIVNMMILKANPIAVEYSYTIKFPENGSEFYNHAIARFDSENRFLAVSFITTKTQVLASIMNADGDRITSDDVGVK